MSRQNSFIKEIRSRIDNYFNLVLRSVRDTIPKQVGFFLVQKSQDKLNQDLWHRINTNARISDMLGEPPNVTARRNQLTKTITTLKNSLRVIQRDPDITSAGMDGMDAELAQELRANDLEQKKNIQNGFNPNQQKPGPNV